MPYTSLLMSALSCGLSWERAGRMTYGELTCAIRARGAASGGGAAQAGGGQRVRDATRADIRKFMS